MYARLTIEMGEVQIFASSQTTPTSQGAGKLTPLLTARAVSRGVSLPAPS